jgi:hypothetical protein
VAIAETQSGSMDMVPLVLGRHLARLAVAAALTAALAAPAAAQGAFTIGSNLATPPTETAVCSPQCTLGITSLENSARASGGITSPVNGTVVLWRIRIGGDTGPTAFRVIRPVGGGLSIGAGTSPTVTPAVDTTSSYPVQLPISIGDLIGVDCCVLPGLTVVGPGVGTVAIWSPVLADGTPARAPGDVDPFEITVNAEIQPTSTFSIEKVKPKKGGKVRVVVELPNPGTLVAGDSRANLQANTSAAGKKKAKFLRKSSEVVNAPGQNVLVVKATKAARSRLADRGKLRAKLKLIYTPIGGASSTEVQKVKLKP